MSAIRWSELALADLTAIADHLAEQDIDLAIRVVEAVQQSVARLAIYPRSGSPLDLHNARKISVPRFRYVVIYELDGDAVVVSRVWHMSRNWPT